MKMEDQKIIFEDEQGNKTELMIYFTYTSEKFKKEYVIFYAPQNETELIAGYLKDGEVLDIENDEEFDELEEVIASYEDEAIDEEEEDEEIDTKE